MTFNFCAVPVDQIPNLLKTDVRRGLSKRQARRRFRRNGPNRIVKHGKPGLCSILVSQFKDLMVLTLLGATVISAAMGEFMDAIVIAAIVILNALLGTVQEYKAEESIESLENYTPQQAWVIRDGVQIGIDREEIVPGDLILLWPGLRIAADARLVESKALQVEESALTGEALPVSKDACLVLPSDTPLSDRKNMVYGGTLVTRGEGRAVVTATGMNTEIGKIANLLGSARSQRTPLERRLEYLGRVILVVCLAACLALAMLGLLKGIPFHEIFLTAVSLAVAAIPEGLPATVTLCLAIGVQRMAKNGAIVRKLEAIETLGSVTAICFDKTGTLTRNKMEIVEVALPEDVAPLSSALPKNSVKKLRGDNQSRGCNNHRIREILQVAVLASDARHLPDGDSSVGEDPTEQAIVVKSFEVGIDPSLLDEKYPRLAERSFTPERRMMSVKVKTKEGALICVKGATDAVIPLCRNQMVNGKIRELDGRTREAWSKWVDSRAMKGMRILAVAKRVDRAHGKAKIASKYREITGQADYQETDLVLLGCLAMTDPLRSQAAASVEMCRIAGIKPVLVTGDHLKTAESVARESHILATDEKGITGEALDKVSKLHLPALVEKYEVFARVSPAHKLKMVRALKRLGHVVAMTGDGVNDAPALKEAAVGIAMGRTGTDVARQSSSMVITDDDFSTIVKAIEEGRAIYDNIRKAVRYLLSCNLGEVITMAATTLLGLPLPLSPIEILWMNLVTDGLPALALSVDPPDTDLMKRPPRDPGEGIFARGLVGLILARGIYIGVAGTLVFIAALRSLGYETASTMTFATLVTVQLVSALDCRSETKSLVEIGPFSNIYLIAACLLSWLMLFVTVQYAPLASLFHTVPLSPEQWLVVFMVSVFPDIFQAAFLRKR